jgi:hypothetical protein
MGDISGPLRGAAVASHGLRSQEEWEWGVYIERVWAPWAINFYCICLMAGAHRLAALILQHSGHIDDAVKFSLLQTITALSTPIFISDEFWFVLKWIQTCASNYMPFVGQDALYYLSISIPLRIPNVLLTRISTAIWTAALRTSAIERPMLSSGTTQELLLAYSFLTLQCFATDHNAEMNVFVAVELLTLAFQLEVVGDNFGDMVFVSNWALANIFTTVFLLFRIHICLYHLITHRSRI